jgi:hypothetical protein
MGVSSGPAVRDRPYTPANFHRSRRTPNDPIERPDPTAEGNI